MSKVHSSSSKATLESLGDGKFAVSGVLDATTVTDVLDQSRQSFAGVERVNVDFAAVTESDSSGLALLIEWLRLARAAGQQIHFDNIPEQIMALARISEVDELLSSNGAQVPAGEVAEPA